MTKLPIFASQVYHYLQSVLYYASILLLVSLPLSKTAFATDCPAGMSALDCQAIVGGYVDWVPNRCGGSVAADLVGADNTAKAVNFLLDKGVPVKASAAIVGNLWFESGGVDPRIVEPVPPDHPQTESDTIPDYALGHGGYGIAQWTDAGRQNGLIQAAHDAGKLPSDLGVQLNYLWTEAMSPSYVSVLDATKQADTVDTATAVWMNGYERPATDRAHLSERVMQANKISNDYGGNTVACVGSSDFVRNFTEYKQCNDNAIGIHVPWANTPYATSTVCAAGCGPSAMAMIITNMTGQRVTPDMTATYGAEHGTAAPASDAAGHDIPGTAGQGGSYWTISSIIGDHWGLKSTEVGFDEKDIPAINDALDKGGLILATGAGPLPFSSVGHILVVRAHINDGTSNGKWLLGNSMTGIGNTIDTKYDPVQLTTSTAGSHPHNAWIITKK